MFVLFFVLWIIFNGSITLEIALFGIAIALAVYAFCCKYMGFSIKKDILYVRRILLFVRYLAILISEIVKANITMAQIIHTKDERELKPVIFEYKTHLNTKVGRVLFANAITLTPGTITVSLIDDRLIINAVDESLMFSEDDFIFEHLIKELEEGHRIKESKKGGERA